MKSVPLSTLVLGSALVSIATVYATDLAARDKSSQAASVSAGGVSVSAGRGGASVSGGGASVSADRGGASVSADRGGASVSGSGASVSADRGGADLGRDGDRKEPALRAAERGRQVGDRSYDSIGEWFEDLRSMFGGKRRGPDVVTEEGEGTTTHSSVTHTTETSESGGTQINRARVVQKGSPETTNVTRIEQRN